MSRLPRSLLLLAALLPSLSSGQVVSFSRTSTIRIEGRATIGPWKCAAPAPPADVTMAPRMSGSFSIPVLSFECGNPRMNQDMFTALRSSSFPSIFFTATSYDTLPSSGGDRLVRVTGTLEIAGVRHVVVVPARIHKLSPSSYRATGSISFRMTEYGVKPPVALFGMIKARDKVTVFFDLTLSSFPVTAMGSR